MKKLTLVAAIAFAAIAVSASAAGSTVVVKRGDVFERPDDGTPVAYNWEARLTGGATDSFNTGPGTAPSGAGSLLLTTTASSDHVQVYNYNQVGTPLSAITGMSYSTYQTIGSGPYVAGINIEIDKTGGAYVAGDYATLVFEPVYNPAQGSVVNGAWQSWNAINGGAGMWWLTRDLPGYPRGTTFTWATLQTLLPNATILGGFGVNQGSGATNLASAVDVLSLSTVSNGTVTYDFEPTLTPANKDQCKNNGWKTFNTPAFKNQGDCVSYIATGGRR
jgi:hypothetical protein